MFKDQKTVLATISRPLGDKTPLPNRFGNALHGTPLPQKSKLSKLAIIEAAKEDLEDYTLEDGETMHRPSSLRKHMKHPRNSIPRNFETPMNNGRHWDISDGDVDVFEMQNLVEETLTEDEDDLSDVEYCPPNNLGVYFVNDIAIES